MAGLSGKYEGIDPRLVDILRGVSERLNIPLQVNSGYRPGDSGMHGSRLAADVQIRHLSDEQKAALVQEAHRLGATRFITYDTSGHLHIDLSKDNGPFWPMHTPAGTGPKGGSNRHMGSAPGWFRDVVSQIQGAPQPAPAPSPDPRMAGTTGGAPAIDPRMASAAGGGGPAVSPYTLPDRWDQPMQMPPQATAQPTLQDALPPELLQLLQGEPSKPDPWAMLGAMGAGILSSGGGPGAGNWMAQGVTNALNVAGQQRKNDLFAAQTQLGIMKLLGLERPSASEQVRGRETRHFVEPTTGRGVTLELDAYSGRYLHPMTGTPMSPEEAAAMVQGMVPTDRLPNPGELGMGASRGGSWDVRDAPDGSMVRVNRQTGAIETLMEAPPQATSTDDTPYEITLPDGTVTYSRGFPAEVPPGARVSKIGTGGGSTSEAQPDPYAPLFAELDDIITELEENPEKQKSLGTFGRYGAVLSGWAGLLDAAVGTNAQSKVGELFGGADPAVMQTRLKAIVVPVAKRFADPKGPLSENERQQAQQMLTLLSGEGPLAPKQAMEVIRTTARLARRYQQESNGAPAEPPQRAEPRLIPGETVEDGYRYLGGDPGQASSWELVP